MKDAVVVSILLIGYNFARSSFVIQWMHYILIKYFDAVSSGSYTNHETQYGFPKHFSTDLALIAIVDQMLNAMENRELVLGVYMDLSKAFDTINHDIL